MAGCDYRSCDVCGRKAFYDANLNYERGDPDNYRSPPFNEVGKPQTDNPESLEKYGLRLDYLGDWAVLCTECAKTHRCLIIPRVGNDD